MNGVCSPLGTSSGCSASGGAPGAQPTDRSSICGASSTGTGGAISLTGSATRGPANQPRRSRSQGTRKLHKCLSTASYTEDSHGYSQTATPNTAVAVTANQQRQLLVARQYCSFGSTVTDTANYFYYYCIYISIYLTSVILRDCL